MAYHLSIFVENKPGKLENITKILSEKNINIYGIYVASAGEFGVVKILTNNLEKAYQTLKQEGFTVSKRKVTIVLLPDKPGEMHKLLTILSSNNINLEDCYGFVLEAKAQAAIVLEAEKYPLIEDVLHSKGYKLLPAEKLEEL
jgi:hypothetical protein